MCVELQVPPATKYTFWRGRNEQNPPERVTTHQVQQFAIRAFRACLSAVWLPIGYCIAAARDATEQAAEEA